jgi:D-3-phosphoglycerate dehydrogenase
VARFKIVTTGPGKTDHSLEMETLGPIGAEIVEISGDEAELIKAVADADAIYGKGRPRITGKVIEAGKKLKVVSLGSVGVDSVDVDTATQLGIPVTNVPDTFIEEVADHAMMLLLAAHRRCIEQDRMVREGRWSEGRPQLLQVPRLMGQTLGFIGFGRVARATARRAKAFGLHMKAYDPYVEELTLSALGVEPASLSEVLSTSDFVSMHLPDTPETRGFLKEHHFRQMKKNAIFVTTGRGPTVNEAALIKALEEKWIAGAGLDVFEIEPTRPDNPLHRMPHIILSPHNASASSRFDPARKRRVGQELALTLQGKWPMSCVNPTVLAKSSLRRWQPYAMDRGPNS